MSSEQYDSAQTYRRAAVAANEAGDYASALYLIEKFSDLCPEDLGGYVVKGFILESTGRSADASEVFRLVTEHGGEERDAKGQRAEELASTGLFHSLINLGRAEEACAEAARYFALPHSRKADSYFDAWKEMEKNLARGFSSQDILQRLREPAD